METVFHLAAKNCITDCQADPVETSDINVTGTVNVFEACKRAGVKKVVYAESSALYEGSQKYPTPEEDEHIESFYAASKLAEKYFAQAYARFHRMNLTALRYFCVYGPRQDYRRSIPPVISAFILKLLKGERPVIYGDGKKRRDFVYVDDVNNFHVQCLKDPKTNGETFNLGSGENYSVREIYDAVESILKTGIQPEFRPDLPGESQITLADISKAGALGWKPKTTLKQGLKKSIEFIWEHVLQSPGIGRG
jgi:UDP-glucose 4-epimerase